MLRFLVEQAHTRSVLRSRICTIAYCTSCCKLGEKIKGTESPRRARGSEQQNPLLRVDDIKIFDPFFCRYPRKG